MTSATWLCWAEEALERFAIIYYITYMVECLLLYYNRYAEANLEFVLGGTSLCRHDHQQCRFRLVPEPRVRSTRET